MQSVEDAARVVGELRAHNTDVMVSADLEGGWVHHLTLTEDDLVEFNFLAQLLDLKQQEEAFYGSTGETLGEVSNGCVRLPNNDTQELLHSIPLGTFVVITK